LKADYSRTLTNIIEIYKKEDKKREAFKLIDEILDKDEKNLKALYMLGKLYLEDKDVEKSERSFSAHYH